MPNMQSKKYHSLSTVHGPCFHSLWKSGPLWLSKTGILQYTPRYKRKKMSIESIEQDQPAQQDGQGAAGEASGSQGQGQGEGQGTAEKKTPNSGQ
jgi:hypothetical protein